MRVLVKKPGESIFSMYMPSEKNNFKEIIGCNCLDKIILKKELYMYVDDSFALKEDLAYNFTLKDNKDRLLHICGNVIVSRIKIVSDDFDYIDTTPGDLKSFNEILRKSKQLEKKQGRQND